MIIWTLIPYPFAMFYCFNVNSEHVGNFFKPVFGRIEFDIMLLVNQSAVQLIKYIDFTLVNFGDVQVLRASHSFD